MISSLQDYTIKLQTKNRYVRFLNAGIVHFEEHDAMNRKLYEAVTSFSLSYMVYPKKSVSYIDVASIVIDEA